MEINTNNLINKDMLEINNLENTKSIELKNKNEKQLKEVCDNFESYFINQTLDVSLRSSNIAGEGAGSDIIKSMYLQSVADSSTGNLGISSMLYEFLTKNKQ